MAAPAPSRFDGNQVLQHAFDEIKGKLRVDASVSLGGSEVIIDHTNDSIRLGDGIDLFTGTTVGGSTGLDINIIGSNSPLQTTPTITSVGSNPQIFNLSMNNANTEYSQILPNNTKRVEFKARNLSKIQYSFTSGQSFTNYITLSPGAREGISGIQTTSTLTLYAQATKNFETLEIFVWT